MVRSLESGRRLRSGLEELNGGSWLERWDPEEEAEGGKKLVNILVSQP